MKDKAQYGPLHWRYACIRANSLKAFSVKAGFTIVELLIVVVVISVLAAVTVVAYNGIQNQADVSQKVATMSQIVKQVKMYQSQYGILPGADSIDACADPNMGYISTCHVKSANSRMLKTADDDTVISPTGHRVHVVSISPETFLSTYNVAIPEGYGYYFVRQTPFSNNEGIAFVLAQFRSREAIPADMRIPKSTDTVFPLEGPAFIWQSDVQKTVADVSGRQITCLDSSTPTLSGSGDLWSDYPPVTGSGSSAYLTHIPSNATLTTSNSTGLWFGGPHIRCSGVAAGSVKAFTDRGSGHRGAMVIGR